MMSKRTKSWLSSFESFAGALSNQEIDELEKSIKGGCK
jgi:hypothetical protein